MNKFHINILILAFLFMLNVTAQAGDSYEIPWHTVNGGSETIAGSGYELHGSIGQSAAGGPIESGGFSLTGGFQAIHVKRVCTEDIDGSGEVDVVDLLAVLFEWGSTGVPEDINNDGTVDVLDLLAVLVGWGTCP